MLDRIAFLSERIGELEGQNRILQERISFLKGDRSTTIDHAEWVIQSLLDRFNDDPYIHDLDEVSDYLVQALAALGSVTHGDVETNDVF